MLQFLLIMLFRISLKNPSLSVLIIILFMLLIVIIILLYIPIANDIQCTSVVTSCVRIHNNITQVMHV